VLIAGGFARNFVCCHGFVRLQFSHLVDPLNAEAGFFCLCDVLEANNDSTSLHLILQKMQGNPELQSVVPQ
jgi:hypothetical protein